MSLVADYHSDSDENESSDEEKTSDLRKEVVEKLNEPVSEKHHNNSKEEIFHDRHTDVNQKIKKPDSETGLFLKLPEKKILHNLKNSEDQIEDFIPTVVSIKQKQKVRITIPSLSDFKDDEINEPSNKKIKPAKDCGLLSLLPAVKGSIKTTKSFVPNVVANKNKNVIKSRSQKTSNCIPSKSQTKNSVLSKKQNNLSDSENEDIEMPETFDDEMWLKVCGKPKQNFIATEPTALTKESVDIAPEPEKPYDGLDNEAFKQLVGKTKRPLGNIKLRDINEEEILPDKDIWMTKSLTDPEMAPKPTVDDPVDPTRRKKHHITYLAQQAKANEQELANAWAASKNSRLASRAKYGF